MLRSVALQRVGHDLVSKQQHCVRIEVCVCMCGHKNRVTCHDLVTKQQHCVRVEVCVCGHENRVTLTCWCFQEGAQEAPGTTDSQALVPMAVAS